MATPKPQPTDSGKNVRNASQGYWDNAAKQEPTTERKEPVPVRRSTRGATKK